MNGLRLCRYNIGAVPVIVVVVWDMDVYRADCFQGRESDSSFSVLQRRFIHRPVDVVHEVL